MNRIKLFIVINILLLLASCGGNRKIEQQITSADSLMDANQDSALVALSMLDSLKAKKPEMSEAQRMRYELVYAKGMNKGYVNFTTDSVMKEVVAYYDKNGSGNEKMLAYYLLGCAYRDLKDVPASLDSYLQATEQADTVSPNCDYKTLARIYGQIGDVYLRQKLPLNAKEAYQKNEKYAWATKDTLSALIAAEAQVNALRLSSSPQRIIELFNIVYKKYKKYGYSKEAARSLGISIQSLVLTKQYAKAKRYMDIYEKESGYFGKEMDSSIRYYTYFYAKGLYYLGLHSDSAKIYFQECTNLAKNVNAKRIAFDGWYKYYKQRHQLDSIEKYADLFIQYSDSVRIHNETETISQASALYNYSRWQKTAELQEVEKDKAHAIIVLMSILGVVFIITVVSSAIL